jgi:hypothetical protein
MKIGKMCLRNKGDSVTVTEMHASLLRYTL